MGSSLVLKRGVPNVRNKPFAPLLPDGGSLLGGGVYDEIVSGTFLLASLCFPSCLPNLKGLLCQFFKEKIVPFIAVDSICPWEEVNSGSSYVAIFLMLPNRILEGILIDLKQGAQIWSPQDDLVLLNYKRKKKASRK